MRLLILRHAIAVPAGSPGMADHERPLTPRGRKRFTKAARGLARTVRAPDLLLTSPLPRARETAEIAARAWGGVTPTEEPRLAGGHVEEVVASLGDRGEDDLVALVGHEPDVSRLVAHLVGGAGEHLPFKKGGAALIEMYRDAPAGGQKGGAALIEMDGDAPGRGRLIWFLPPRLLRRLGGG